MFVLDSFVPGDFWSKHGLIIFPHIPKTAGTSIRRVFSDVLKDQVYIHDETEPLLDRVQRLGTEAFASVKLIIGHMPMGLHTEFPDRPVKYVSVVREPIDRIASHYLHVYRFELFQDAAELILATDGVVEFVRALGRTYGEGETIIAKNCQTWNLFPEIFMDACPGLSNAEILERQATTPPPDEKWIANTLESMANDRFLAIGSQDQLWEFISYVLSLFGHETIAPPQENVGFGHQTRNIVRAEEYPVLENWNTYDRILYSFVNGTTAPAALDAQSNAADRIGLLADVRLRALQQARAEFLPLKADYLRAREIIVAMAAERENALKAHEDERPEFWMSLSKDDLAQRVAALCRQRRDWEQVKPPKN